MRCRHCNAELEPGSNFCDECGKPVTAAPPAARVSAPPPTPAALTASSPLAETRGIAERSGPRPEPPAAGAAGIVETLRIALPANLTRGGAAFSPDGKSILAALGDRTVRLWDAATGAETLCLRGHTGGILSAGFSRDGTTIFSAGDDYEVRLWERATGREVRRISCRRTGWRTFFTAVPSGWVCAYVALSPDGRHVLTAGFYEANVWDAATGQKVRCLDESETCQAYNAVAFSPDGRHALAAGPNHLWLWDTSTGAVVRKFEELGSSVAAFSPDGRYVISTFYNAQGLKLWDLSGGVVGQFDGHSTRFTSVAFSPDGKLVVSGSQDPAVQLWDVERRKELYRFEANAESAGWRTAPSEWLHPPSGILTGRNFWSFVAFSPDGRSIVAGWNNTIRLWRLPAHSAANERFHR